MLIDWFTVGAQVVNFLILVWLLKRFLYRPILDAIDAREQRIATTLADADAKKARADRERDEFQRRIEDFDQRRDELLSQATQEARTERQRLLDEARQVAEDVRVRRQDALRREHRNLGDEITRRAREEVFAIARKTLADLSNTRLEESMAGLFVRRLRELEGETREGLAEALKAAVEPAVVRSAFDLPPKQQEAILAALRERFGSAADVRFETAPQVIGGIELVAHGRKVAWSIDGYVTSLERSIAELLDGTKEEPGSDAEPRGKRVPTEAR